MKIDIYDNVLEDHNAILVDDEVRKLKWEYDYKSATGKPNLHWHALLGHNKEECVAGGYDWADNIFEHAKNKLDFKTRYGITEYERIYCNGQTFGLETHLHYDDSDSPIPLDQRYTFVFYPRLDWKAEWGGGTIIYNKDTLEIEAQSKNKGNRMVAFHGGAHPHGAAPVSRHCYELRIIVVFKCIVT